MVVMASALFLAPAILHAAGPWKGRILDIETKEPLEGTVVLAVWERVYRTPAGPNAYFYNAKEALTDKEGRYEIPSYTPINLLPIISFMRGPRFFIFKPGYLNIEIVLDENVNDKAVELPERGKVFRLAPGVIELPRLRTKEERLQNMPSLPGLFYSIDPRGKAYVPHKNKVNDFIKLLIQNDKELGIEPSEY